MTEPVTSDEAKEFLRVVHTSDDALIDRLIVSAREHVEVVIGSDIETAWPSGVPEEVKTAILLRVQADYEADPDAADMLRKAAMRRLFPYRLQLGV